MRIEYLRLPAFGKFTDHDIQFSPEHGLHLIYGRNEAGKSTLLRAVSHALFGIPRDSSDDFLHSSSSLRIEAGLRLTAEPALLSPPQGSGILCGSKTNSPWMRRFGPLYLWTAAQ